MHKEDPSLQDEPENEAFLKGSPLMSWDIIMEGYHRISRLIDDGNRLSELAATANWKHQWNFKNKIVKEGHVVLVTRPDATIQFASENIYNMTGYLPFEVIGKTPGIFQGEMTETYKKAFIRDAVLRRSSFVAELNNYKKSGEVYRCNIEGYPLFNIGGTLVNFIAFEKAV